MTPGWPRFCGLGIALAGSVGFAVAVKDLKTGNFGPVDTIELVTSSVALILSVAGVILVSRSWARLAFAGAAVLAGLLIQAAATAGSPTAEYVIVGYLGLNPLLGIFGFLALLLSFRLFDTSTTPDP
jgi:hypothetical protein